MTPIPTDEASNSSNAKSARVAPVTTGKFGTFGGVFTPCTLTILGVIMFLRFGNVVGNAGLFWSIVILGVSKLITTLTTLSLSAAATNTRVQGGGAYFLISRSLGVEFGGAIGIVFFLAQAISVSMYVIGFTEAFTQSISISVNSKVVAIIVNSIVFACVYIGAGWTIRLQYFILATLVASLVSFFLGAAPQFSMASMQSNFWSDYTPGQNLFTMFALFFPAVTGIMAGANMSGDLKTPSQSIPSGTLWSIIITAGIYLAMGILLAGSASREALQQDDLIVRSVAKYSWLITAGMFAATLSSALGSMMGAPRILQALAKDTIFPKLGLFATGSGPNSEPRRATILTFVISTFCILTADLDSIAPLITMAFMITYGTINLATFYETITRNPSYRPTFRYSYWGTSLAGTLGCGIVMLLIDWQWAIISVLIMSGVYYFIYRKQVVSRWGDLNSGLMFERTRKNLLKLEQSLYHPKNWRPIILAMGGGSMNRRYLAVFGHWLTSGHGILNIGQVIIGSAEDQLDRIENQEELLSKFILKEDLEAFPNVVAAPTLTEGIEYLIQCSGLGALRPNSLLIGWPGEENKAEPLVASLRVIEGLKRNVIIAKFNDVEGDPWTAPEGTIDVWWRGRQNGELMLLLAHLLKQNRKWQNRTIRLMRIVSDEAARDEVIRHLEELAVSSRIEVQAEVFVSDSPTEVIRKQSRNSAITFLGFALPKEGDEARFFQSMEDLSHDIPRTLLISSIGNMKLES